ncbi:anaerobic ribonucleoside-triphosphate reductase activating protein [Campylobacter sp. RM12647]|uniref:anaerobic ribonucleoside-triphosphate reductase activating protein n=1 Tax=Campylobacter sp. RM12647 TaxID=2735737 RepID=UPI001D6E03B2|nr:anaerobic ribonucleoside-triphosphate reductase activating protein [Campylobacter sp. RM12647]
MIYDITPFSVIDYPNYISCIVWIAGCNLRCKYCYNEHIINGFSNVSKNQLKSFLESRVGLVDGVVFSGGECTNSANLLDYIKLAKSLGYLIKIDSNGSNPNVIKNILENDLANYFAIDFKAPKEKLKALTGLDYFDKFDKTLDILLDFKAEFEIRTTWHFDLLSVDEVLKMNEYLRKKGYKNKYYLQKFLEVLNIANLKQSIKTIDFNRLNDDFVLRNFN